MKLLLAMRHGETDASVRALLNGDLRRQPPLNEVGRMQVLRLAEQLREEPIQVCFTSRFVRTIQSADLVLGRPVPRHVLSGLDEVRFGSWFEGRTYQEYVSWVNTHDMIDVPPGRGEPFGAALLRHLDALETAVTSAEQQGLLVAHGTSVALARRLLHLDDGGRLCDFPATEPAALFRLSAPVLREAIPQARFLLLAHMRTEQAQRAAQSP